MLAKFACANLTAKFSAVNLLNSGVVIYLLWSGILFSTAARSAVADKLVILGILFLTSFIITSKVVLLVKLVNSGILSSIFLILALYTSFLIKSFFTTSLSLLKLTGTGTDISTSNLYTLFSNCLYYLVHF